MTRDEIEDAIAHAEQYWAFPEPDNVVRDILVEAAGKYLRGLSLMDIAGVALWLDVRKDTVHKWRSRGLLPQPDWPLSVGPVWERSTIEQWARDTGRLSVDTPSG